MYSSGIGLPYSNQIAIDFEFYGEEGSNPKIVCLVARDLVTGKVSQYWQGELLKMASPPFDTGGDSLIITFFASAELQCFQALGWKPPQNILDLYAEFRCLTNGCDLPMGRSLLGALALFGLDHIAPCQKEQMRELILSGGPWPEYQRSSILAYCQQDVDALGPLLDAILAHESWTVDRLGQALLRGRYMVAVANMQTNGIPIDRRTFKRLQNHWQAVQHQLIEVVDKDFRVFEDTTFKIDKFEVYLEANTIPWPRLTSGVLELKQKTFSRMSKIHPEILPLHELRKTLSRLKLNSLSIGRDDRNRCLLSPFASKTGRNQPSNSRFIFGPAKWIRGLIKPVEGWSIAYCDWSSQEIAIAAALSGDTLLWDAYETGDPYMAFAIQAGLAPPEATKSTHQKTRDRCKQVVLGTNYGMSAHGVAEAARIHILEAKELLQRHRETYRVFWAWAEGNMNRGLSGHRLTTCFGWQIQATSGQPKANTFLNWPMQAAGAEMLRLACCLATERGIRVCAPIHDALLIEAPIHKMDQELERLKECMVEASELILGSGRICRMDSEIVFYPNRFMDEKGADMWDRIMRILDEVTE